MISKSLDQLASFANEPPARSNPFPGLRPFQFEESHLFFGRDGQSERLIAKLAATRFLAVVGTSGSGKSSLVRAGLLPALYSGFMPGAGAGWRIAIMRPGNDPLGNLAQALNAPDVLDVPDETNPEVQLAITGAALRRGSLGLVEAVRNHLPAGENLLVVADQFEELFRVEQGPQASSHAGEQENDRAAFVKLLLAAKAQREVNIYVVLTMRSDYLGDCAQFWDLPEAINEGQYLIPRMTREQIREAITGPLFVGGAEAAPRLINRLLNDVGDNPDQLPILQHALMRTWNYWEAEQLENDAIGQAEQAPRLIDLRHYEAIGGMESALSRHADEAYRRLPDDRHRLVAERVFKALTEKGPDNREIRRPTLLGQLCLIADATEAEVKQVVQTFRAPGRSFLMPPVGTTLTAESLIDISHESLMRNWQRLKDWVEDETKSARIYRRLAETAALHLENKAGLWRDPDLQIALNWLQNAEPNNAWAQRYHPDFVAAIEFLKVSQESQDKEIAEREREQKANFERVRTQRELEQALTLIETQRELTEVERQKTEEQQKRLDEQARTASRLRRLLAGLAALILLVFVVAMLAIWAYRSADIQRKAAVVQQSIANASTIEAIKQTKISLEERGKAEASAKEAAAQRDIAIEARSDAENQRTLALQQQKIAEENAKTSRHFFYVANMNLAQQAYKEKNIEKLSYLLNAFLPSSSIRPDEDLRDFTWYYLWRLSKGEQATLKLTDATILSAAFSPDAKMLATASGDMTVNLWDVRTGKALVTLKGNEADVYSVAFSPDGRILATGGADSTVRMWDVSTRQELATLRGNSSYVSSIAFSSDGRTLAIGSADNTVTLWNISSRQELARLSFAEGPVGSIAIAPDGKTIVIGNANGAVSLWDLSSMRELLEFTGHKSPIISIVFAPTGKTFASGSLDGIVKQWDVVTGQELAILRGFTGSIYSVAFSPDGRTLAYGSGDGTVKLWDIHTRQELATFRDHTETVVLLAFSPNGKALVSAGKYTSIKLWLAATDDEVRTQQNK